MMHPNSPKNRSVASGPLLFFQRIRGREVDGILPSSEGLEKGG